MSQKHLVCQGATCQCQFGNASDKLKVLTQTKAFINEEEPQEKLVATTADIGATFEKNTFGLCQMQPIPGGGYKPCQAMVTQWSGAYDNITYEENNGHPLLEDSKATCPIGGKDCISIINHGQVAEITNRNLHSADPIKMDMINPFMDFGKFVNDSIDSSVNKKITSLTWVDKNREPIDYFDEKQSVFYILAQTQNYTKGETVSIEVEESNQEKIQDGNYLIPLSSVVEADGTALFEVNINEKNTTINHGLAQEKKKVIERRIIARVVGSDVVSSPLEERAKISPTILVTYGQKIVSKDNDDKFVKQTGEGCAKLLGVNAQPVSTGKELLQTMENAGRIGAFVFWGHSWNRGLYLKDNEGFYVDTIEKILGNHRDSSDFELLKGMKQRTIKTHKHSLFIFASCGTALQPAAIEIDEIKYTFDSFAYAFGNYINKEIDIVDDEVTYYYKITTIGATALSNLFWDKEYFKGKVKTDGVFKKIEKLYKITVIPENSELHTNTEIVETRVTDLGKKIDVIKIIKDYDPENISI